MKKASSAAWIRHDAARKIAVVRSSGGAAPRRSTLGFSSTCMEAGPSSRFGLLFQPERVVEGADGSLDVGFSDDAGDGDGRSADDLNVHPRLSQRREHLACGAR